MERLGTVAVVGVGLIGGSVGKAVRERSMADRVVGVGRNEESLREAVRVGAIDAYFTDVARGVENADVVVVCTPVPLIAGVARQAAAEGRRDALVTDAGSTKRTIVADIEGDDVARRVFVGAHPIAGSERKGPGHADPRLFEGRACVLTPTPRTPPDRLRRARAFWKGLGARVEELSPSAHDDALALTSHMPHAVAAALAASVPAEILGLAAGAYRDGTRVAGSDATLWAGILRDNKGPLLDALARFDDQLALFRRALEADDPAALVAWWDVARSRRGRFDALGRGTPPAVED